MPLRLLHTDPDTNIADPHAGAEPDSDADAKSGTDALPKLLADAAAFTIAVILANDHAVTGADDHATACPNTGSESVPFLRAFANSIAYANAGPDPFTITASDADRLSALLQYDGQVDRRQRNLRPLRSRLRTVRDRVR